MKPTISVVIPVYNGQKTIQETLKSICLQKGVVFELIIIDDGSKDNSREIITRFFSKIRVTHIRYKVISHVRPMGLAASYNEGVKAASTDFIITVHDDMSLKKDMFFLLIEPFLKNTSVVASLSSSEYPFTIWKRYPFWGKCLFDRFVGKKITILDGKCSCFSKQALLQVGLFDSNVYRSAGEDGDIDYKLKKFGLIAKTSGIAVHLHALETDFPLSAYVHKHAQLAEAQGATLRTHPFNYFSPVSFVFAFFREFLILGLCIPVINKAACIVIIIYAFVYTRHVFFEPFDIRLGILPFVNIWLLFVSFFYSLKGFIGGKQTI